MSIYGEGLYEDESGQLHSEVRRDLARLRDHDWEPRTEDGRRLRPAPTPEWKRPDIASIYALGKFDQERMCLLVGQAYRIPAVALRFFNVYGRGQALSNPYTGVMAIFGSRLLNGSSPLIFEDGMQMRDFVHVTDVARACRLALEVPEAAGHAFNIGSGAFATVKEIALRMAGALDRPRLKPEITHQYRVGDIRHCFSDIRLASSILGYAPRVSLADGIKDLAEWLVSQRSVDRSRQMREELASRGLSL